MTAAGSTGAKTCMADLVTGDCGACTSAPSALARLGIESRPDAGRRIELVVPAALAYGQSHAKWEPLFADIVWRGRGV